MIKNLLLSGITLAFLSAASVNSNAQNMESFEGAFLPPCWTQIDADGDGQGWFQYSAAGSAYEGELSAGSASWSGDPLTPDNYLISPQMTIGAGEELTYYIAGQDPAWSAENYGVYVSTAGNTDVADFTDALLVETTVNEWTFRSIDMSAYEGQNIYIAFRHFDITDLFYIKLDNVSLPGTFTNEGCEPEVVEPTVPPVMIAGAESFEGSDTDLPACWKMVDADGDGENWTIIPFDDPAYAFDGSNAIASYSYFNVASDPTASYPLTPDNYLITPKLDITAGDTLYYVVKGLDPSYPAETYSVLVSTTGSDVANFTTVAFTETLETGDFQGRTVDLSSYAGSSIYVAFRHHNSTDNFAIVLDAISLPGVNCNPSAVNELETVQSKLYPNPATDKLNVTSSLQGAATITIFDAVGRVVSQKNVNLSDATYKGEISSLESGVYVIQIQAGDKMATQRFIKQ